MRTAFVARPLEFGPEARPDVAPESWLDCCVDSFTALADQLGATAMAIDGAIIGNDLSASR